MARAPRAFAPGIYHLGSHASDDRTLFLTDDEREVFLKGLGQVLERFELGLISYALMGNHYHLLLRIPDARISKALQQYSPVRGSERRWARKKDCRDA